MKINGEYIAFILLSAFFAGLHQWLKNRKAQRFNFDRSSSEVVEHLYNRIKQGKVQVISISVTDLPTGDVETVIVTSRT